jgi:hypothetical protein
MVPFSSQGGQYWGVGGGGWSFWASRREFWHDVHYFLFFTLLIGAKLLAGMADLTGSAFAGN